MSNFQDDEVSLADIGTSLKNSTSSFLNYISLFVSLILRKWVVFLVLLIVGIVVGYFLEKSMSRNYEVTAVVRLNNRSSDYVYNALENLNSNVYEDSIMKQKGLPTGILKSISIEPISSFNDILVGYRQENEQMLRYLLENASAEEILSSEFFRSEYYYHRLTLEGKSPLIEDIHLKLVEMLNTNEFYSSINKANLENLQSTINDFETMVEQIDTTIVRYNNLQKKYAENTSATSGVQIVNSTLEIKQLLDSKKLLLENKNNLKIELIQGVDPVILIGTPMFKVISQKSLLLLVPLLLVGSYLIYLILYLIFNRRRAHTN